MGALHAGHTSLVAAAKKANNITVTYIFVNPIQFNKKEDLENYPSSLEEDLEILAAEGCDIVFVPNKNEMYPEEPEIQISLGIIESALEGAERPGHFNGVALVVLKLLNIIQPTLAYFGQKDLQQFRVIEKLVNDVSLDINLVMMPIVREESGLALSSRNQRLSELGNNIAANIFKALKLAANKLSEGATIPKSLESSKEYFSGYPDIRIEYLTLVNYKDLSIVETASDADRLVLCFAGYIEGVRLIDNIIIDIGKNEN
jgi:pantoate--beta-alanine ligase